MRHPFAIGDQVRFQKAHMEDDGLFFRVGSCGKVAGYDASLIRVLTDRNGYTTCVNSNKLELCK